MMNEKTDLLISRNYPFTEWSGWGGSSVIFFVCLTLTPLYNQNVFSFRLDVIDISLQNCFRTISDIKFFSWCHLHLRRRLKCLFSWSIWNSNRPEMHLLAVQQFWRNKSFCSVTKRSSSSRQSRREQTPKVFLSR